MKEWISNFPELPKVEGEYIKIRYDIQAFNGKVRAELSQEISKKDYYIDANLGMLLYDYLWRQPGFNLRAAANDDFWRYLSVKVVPNVVAERWGYDNESHFWSKPARIWLRSIWWYVHLSWQGDISSTAKVLESACFSTDSILNLEERTGRKGTFINVYRFIMYYYSRIPKITLDEFNKRTKTQQDDLFRVVMRLNTAKVMVVDPALYLGGEKEYVRALFLDAGVHV
jgi:hypothetical protein